MNNYTNPVTVTGNPASFEASGNGKLLSLSVPFSPIQDLHGYDSPWPAGGGKNLIVPLDKSFTNNGVPCVCSASTETISLKGTATGSGGRTAKMTKDVVLPAGTYILSVTAVSGTSKASYIVNRTDDNVYISSTRFSLAEETSVYVGANVTNDTVYDEVVHIQIESGSTATSWMPYENICPISGRTGLSVYVSPTQDPDDATVYNVEWTTEAGTVYGGTLDVVTGVLTVNKVVVDLGTLSWADGTTSVTGKRRFLASLPDSAVNSDTTVGVTSLCSQYVALATGGTFTTANNGYTINGSKIYIYDASHATDKGTTFKTAMSGVQLCYELATPLTYQLTPTQIELLIGQNNVWSDSNEAVTLTYVIELFTRYTFIVNGNDYTGLVERDSYRTAVTPVYGETIQTLDGVGHTALLRVKGSLTVKLNPQTAAQTAAICADLLNAPCEVQYKCLQRNVNVTALMVLDVVSAMFLSRCMYLGQKWNDVDEIVLKEL